MQNFTFSNKTTIVFGRDRELETGELTLKYGTKVLLHYGGGSIKRNGLYERVCASLKEAGITWHELGGVKPNPRLSLVYEGIDICRNENIDLILAVGGGSVIDSAKAIAVGAKSECDVWDYYTRKAFDPEEVLPVATVLTIPAAGSESSAGSVITNDTTQEKLDFGDVRLRPVFSILNPEVTFTLPSFQTACGATDMFAHVCERYFTLEGNVDLSDTMSEAVMRTIIKHAPIALAEPKNYASRAEIMWAGCLAHNDLLGMGRTEEWTSHPIEHELSALYDVAHGAGLATVFPAWMKYVYKENVPRFIRFATKVWNCDYDPTDPEKTALEGIACFEKWLSSIGMPLNLKDLGAQNDRFDDMAKGALRHGSLGTFKKLTKDDVVEIFKLME